MFDPDDWPDDGRVLPGEVRVWPPALVRPMRAWHRWTAARQAWADEHGDRWPTGAVERWVEERAARPGSRTRLAPWDRYDEDGGDWS